MDKISRAALMTSALMVGGAAGAVPVTMSQRINLNNALNASETLSGAFDIRSLLVDSNGAPVTLDLSNARLTAYGYSDKALSFSTNYSGAYQVGSDSFAYGVQQQGVYYYYYSYRCGWLSTCWRSDPTYYYYWVTAYGYVAVLQNDQLTLGQDNVVDTARLNVGDQMVEDGVAYSQGSPTFTGNLGTYYAQYYQNYAERTHYRGLYQENAASGALDFVMDLNEANLTDLQADGLLNFMFNMRIGQSVFNWIQIDLMGEQIAIVEEPEEPEEPTEVPEPGTVAILGLGVLALGIGRRARDRRNKAA